MKIVHICLSCFYVDNMSYQENILPKFHSKEHEVLILTSDFAFEPDGTKTKKPKTKYLNEYGIPVEVLPRSSRYGIYSKKYHDYDGLLKALNRFEPDLIFCHGGQFVALKDIIKYCKKHRNVKLYIDQHGDYYNHPVNTWHSRLTHYFVFGHWLRKACKYTSRFWGVTPWRCTYLNDVYGLPKDKISLLVMGGDDDNIHFEQKAEIRKRIREQYNIGQDDFLVITGGKIDKTKNIHMLMSAVKQLNRSNVKLLVFGKVSAGFEEEFKDYLDESHIRYIGWLNSNTVYDYYLASDLAVFPGTHSVLWEQACACGIPGVYKLWEGMQHVNVDGNALFLERDSVDEIKEKILSVIDDKEFYQKMKSSAQNVAKVFSYKEIAKKAIEG